jgi:hypothetical protein
MSDCEHVGFRLPGRDRSHDFQRLGIDDGNGVVEFRSDIENMVDGIENRAVRPYAMTEVDRGHDLAGIEIDDQHRTPIGARLAYS